jgi:hypothetical protein
MMPRAPLVVAPPPVFRPDWKTLVRLASTWSKPLALDACPTPTSFRRFYVATDKPKPTWFWGPNLETVALILSPKSPNQSCRFGDSNRETLHHLGFEAKTRETVATSFEDKLEKTVATSFEAKLEKTVATGFQAKPLGTVATDFEAKSAKTVQVDLRPNHSPTVVIGFEAQIDEKPSQWFWC